MEKPRILLLVNRWYPDGGVENFLEQLVAETLEAVDYTICSLTTGVDSKIACSKIGPVLSSGRVQDMFVQGKAIKDAMQSSNYSVVHIQASNGSAFYLAGLAKEAGIPRRIVHSHNAGAETSSNPIKMIVGRACSRIWSNAATDLWACSSNAGAYLFGSREFQVFRNGIDLDRFAFSWEKRRRVRQDLGIEDGQFLLGSIGRISLQKNPIFQLEVFSQLRKFIPDARFCMVGRGDLEAERDAALEAMSLKESVIIVPRTLESDAFYCAFDALLFPPVFEGLSFVGIESQCSGLPVYASNAVPSELDVTDRILFLSLGENPTFWARKIFEGSGVFALSERTCYKNKMYSAGFDRRECFANVANAYAERKPREVSIV